MIKKLMATRLQKLNQVLSTLMVGFAFLVGALSLLSCTSKVQEGMSPSELALKLSGDACSQGKCPCLTPQGSAEHGSKMNAYKKSEVECGAECGAVIEERTCDNGKWVGGSAGASGGEVFFSCREKLCQDCIIGGQRISHKGKIDLFSKKEAACGETCSSFRQERICMNGTLSGDARFSEVECLPKVCNCNLPVDNGSIALGGSMEFFSSQQATCAQACQKKTRTCRASGGVPALDGDVNFKYQNCNPAATCKCRLPNNQGELDDGATARLHKVQTVSCGESCDSKGYLDVKCKQGQLVHPTTGVPITTGDYQYKCAQPSCTFCTLPNGGKADRGTEPILYLAEQQTCAAKCADTLKKFVCDAQGVLWLAGVKVTNLADFANYKYDTCNDATNCKCKLPKAERYIEHNAKINLSSVEKPSCGQTCGSTMSFICNNGNLQYENSRTTGPDFWRTYYECVEPVCSICDLPWGEKLLGPSEIWGFNSQQVDCNKSCESAKFSCENNKLYQTVGATKTETSRYSSAFKYKSCESQCKKCRTPWGLEIPSGSKVAAYKKIDGTDAINCGKPCPMEFLTCENGVLKGNQAYAYPKCENKCNTEGGGAPGWSCRVPWSYQLVAPGTQVSAFSRNIVACTESCASFRATLTCDLKTGEWKGGAAEHIYPSCYEDCP